MDEEPEDDEEAVGKFPVLSPEPRPMDSTEGLKAFAWLFEEEIGISIDFSGVKRLFDTLGLDSGSMSIVFKRS